MSDTAQMWRELQARPARYSPCPGIQDIALNVGAAFLNTQTLFGWICAYRFYERMAREVWEFREALGTPD